MKIGIIGAGNVATGLGKFWAQKGHDLFFSYSRDQEKLKRTAASIHPSAKAGSVQEAVAFGDVVVLAMPYSAVDDALKAAGPLSGKLILSCVNALKADSSGLVVGTTTSAAEEIAGKAEGARVVEGLPAFAELLHSDSQTVQGARPTVFTCGGDTKDKAIARQLLEEAGMEVIDAGGLVAARFIEPAMMLLVSLAYQQGYGGRVAFKFLHDLAEPRANQPSAG